MKIPWENRKEMAFWHGSSSSSHKSVFGWANSVDKEKEYKFNHLDLGLRYHLVDELDKMNVYDKLLYRKIDYVEKKHPSPNQVFSMVMKRPEIYIRAYAVWWGLENPDYLKAGFSDSKEELKEFKRLTQELYDQTILEEW